jgi:hypothetical protein
MPKDSKSSSRRAVEEVEEVELEVDQSDNSGSDNDSNTGSETIIDLTENPLYQVLSALLEDEQGNNICHHLQCITGAIEENTKVMKKFMEKLATASAAASTSSSSGEERHSREHREKKEKKSSSQ